MATTITIESDGKKVVIDRVNDDGPWYYWPAPFPDSIPFTSVRLPLAEMLRKWLDAVGIKEEINATEES